MMLLEGVRVTDIDPNRLNRLVMAYFARKEEEVHKLRAIVFSNLGNIDMSVKALRAYTDCIWPKEDNYLEKMVQDNPEKVNILEQEAKKVYGIEKINIDMQSLLRDKIHSNE